MAAPQGDQSGGWDVFGQNLFMQNRRGKRLQTRVLRGEDGFEGAGHVAFLAAR